MSTEATPANVGSNAGLGPLVKNAHNDDPAYSSNQVAAIVAAEVAAERERLAAEFTKRAKALNTTGTGCAPHIQAQYEAMAGELLDWACVLRA